MWILLALAVVIGVFLFVKLGHKRIPPAPSNIGEATTTTDAIDKKERDSSILAHISNWPEVYLWLPIAILNVILLAKFSHFLTGRMPLDNGIDWVQKGEHVLTCVFLIVLMSIWKEANGDWMTPAQKWAERQAHPMVGVAEKVKQLGIFLGFIWILLK